jgi:hypothetical protein
MNPEKSLLNLTDELFKRIEKSDSFDRFALMNQYLRMAYCIGADQMKAEIKGYRPIAWIDDYGVVQKRFISMHQASVYLDIPSSNIRSVLCGDRHMAGGKKFQYAAEKD